MSIAFEWRMCSLTCGYDAVLIAYSKLLVSCDCARARARAVELITVQTAANGFFAAASQCAELVALSRGRAAHAHKTVARVIHTNVEYG